MIREIKNYDSSVCCEIGKRIQDQRVKKKIKGIELACDLEISKNQMSRIENGKANCTIQQLYILSQRLDCSVDFLLFGDTSINYPPDVVELTRNIYNMANELNQKIER